MKELEKLLLNIPKPDVKVTLFKQNLRRSLLNSGRYARDGFGSISHGFLFFAPTALAGVLVIVLGLFVIYPKIPSNFHNSLSPSATSLDLKEAAVQQNENETVTLNGNLASWFEQLHQATEEDLDKAFVWYLSQEQQPFDPGTIQPVGRTRFLAVSQYQLNNGQRILVYTQLPDEQISYFRAY